MPVIFTRSPPMFATMLVIGATVVPTWSLPASAEDVSFAAQAVSATAEASTTQTASSLRMRRCMSGDPLAMWCDRFTSTWC
jgi:hypothetical protein